MRLVEEEGRDLGNNSCRGDSYHLPLLLPCHRETLPPGDVPGVKRYEVNECFGGTQTICSGRVFNRKQHKLGFPCQKVH